MNEGWADMVQELQSVFGPLPSSYIKSVVDGKTKIRAYEPRQKVVSIVLMTMLRSRSMEGREPATSVDLAPRSEHLRSLLHEEWIDQEYPLKISLGAILLASDVHCSEVENGYSLLIDDKEVIIPLKKMSESTVRRQLASFLTHYWGRSYPDPELQRPPLIVQGDGPIESDCTKRDVPLTIPGQCQEPIGPGVVVKCVVVVDGKARERTCRLAALDIKRGGIYFESKSIRDLASRYYKGPFGFIVRKSSNPTCAYYESVGEEHVMSWYNPDLVFNLSQLTRQERLTASELRAASQGFSYQGTNLLLAAQTVRDVVFDAIRLHQFIVIMDTEMTGVSPDDTDDWCVQDYYSGKMTTGADLASLQLLFARYDRMPLVLVKGAAREYGLLSKIQKWPAFYARGRSVSGVLDIDPIVKFLWTPERGKHKASEGVSQKRLLLNYVVLGRISFTETDNHSFPEMIGTKVERPVAVVPLYPDESKEGWTRFNDKSIGISYRQSLTGQGDILPITSRNIITVPIHLIEVHSYRQMLVLAMAYTDKLRVDCPVVLPVIGYLKDRGFILQRDEYYELPIHVKNFFDRSAPTILCTNGDPLDIEVDPFFEYAMIDPMIHIDDQKDDHVGKQCFRELIFWQRKSLQKKAQPRLLPVVVHSLGRVIDRGWMRAECLEPGENGEQDMVVFPGETVAMGQDLIIDA